MVSFKALSVVGAIACLLSPILASPVARPEYEEYETLLIEERSSSSTYWLPNIKKNGTIAFGDNASNYTIYRNVVSYGADPSGETDSTAAINDAISDGDRCGYGCDSSTTTPAIVYFPPGTYLVSTPIVQYYYTQLIGDAINPPTLKAAESFTGMAVIDADPYTTSGDNWYTNQNNFYRQVRNFIIDLTSMPETAGAGIHWQVAQATSLQNIVFNMIEGSSSAQIGIFMDNGSGGFMTDLVFNGGNYGAFFGNQQFTSRNMTFNNCNTAIYMNWNWVWTMQGITINDCDIGIDMSNGGTSDQLVGSVLLLDSTFTSTPIGIKTAYVDSSSNTPSMAGTLVLRNVDFSGATVAVENTSGDTIIAGGQTITTWGQGRRQVGYTGTRVQQTLANPSMPTGLLNSEGEFYTRSRPQYQTYSQSAFVHVKSYGAKGDGSTDDTAAIQAAMDATTTSQILYFDHGAYIVTDTITVPDNIKITGEIWPLIMAYGSNFDDVDNPIPVFKVGTSGASGAVEMSDLIFETKGPAPGAIMVEWNLASTQGASGMWDVHWRIGGSAGTEMQSTECLRDSTVTHGADSSCVGAFLLFHATSTATNVYMENTWLWVADHELDISGSDQIDIYNGRGMLIEGTNTWLWGTSVEHSVLYNYQFNAATNIYAGHIQSETPYFQGNPNALDTPFVPNTATWNDPTFAICSSQHLVAPCYKSWGLRVVNSDNVFVYGTGLYSFFQNYNESCVDTNNCQQNIISVQSGSTNVHLYGVTTKASTNMITWNGWGAAFDDNNRNVFGATVMHFTQS